MNTEAGVARGVAALYIANITTLVLNTLFLVVLTNYVSLAEVGLVSLLNILVVGTATFSVLALPMVSAGTSATPPAVTRFLSQFLGLKDGSARWVYFVSLLACGVTSVTISLLVSLPPVAKLIVGPLDESSVAFAAIDALVYSFGQLGAYSLLGTGKATTTGKLITATSTVRYVLAGAFLILGYGVPGIFLGFALGDLPLAVLANGLTFTQFGSMSKGRVAMGPVAKYMVSVLAAAVIGLGVSQTDKLLAYFQTGLGNLGIYNIATVGAAVASFAPSAATNVLVPSLSSRGATKESRNETLRNYTRYISVIASPMGFGLAAVSPFLLQIFGPSYVAAAPLLSVISISIAFTAVSSVYSSALLVEDKAHHFSLGNLAGLLVLFAVVFATTPTLGLMGVALGRAAMLFVTLGLFAMSAQGIGHLVLDRMAYAKSMLAGAAMGIAVYGVLLAASVFAAPTRSEAVVASVIMLPVGFLLYLVIMKALKGFSSADADFIESIFPRWLSRVGELARRLV